MEKKPQATSRKPQAISNQRGAILIFSLLVIAIVMSITFAVLGILIPKIKIASDPLKSVVALYAADSGLEWCLYVNRQSGVPPLVLPTPTPPPTSGLQAYWTLDETSGTTAADSSGNSNTGTLVNSPTWVTGKLNNALNFDGSNDYVNSGTGTSLDMGAGDFSLSVWFKSSSEFARAIVGKGGIGVGGTRYLLRTDENLSDCGVGKIEVEIDDDTVKKILCSSGSSFNNNAWHHAVVVRDGNNLRLYEDGQQLATPTDITGYGNINSPRIFSIGSLFDEGALGQASFFPGLIDEVRIYNRALTQTEITTLYNYTGSASQLVGHWKLNEISPSITAADSSGNGHTGTLVNGPVWTSGQLNNGLNFDGVNDGVSIANSSAINLGTSDFTITGWVNPVLSGATKAILVKTADTGWESPGKTYGLSGSTGRQFFDAWGLGLVTSNTAVPTGTFNHVAVTFRSNTDALTFYLNGNSDGGGSLALTADNLSHIIKLGLRGATGIPFAGILDDIRIYNWVLTQADITAIKNYTETATTIPPPVLDYNPTDSTTRPTFVIYAPASGFTPATCTETALDYRVVGTYRDIARSFEIY